MVPESVAAAVATTLGALTLPRTDAAQAALVLAYAREVDAAEVRMQRLDRVLSRLSRQADPDLYEALRVAQGMLSARATLDRLGGRLQTGLDALRATPRSRPIAPPHAPAASPLGQLRLAAQDGDVVS